MSAGLIGNFNNSHISLPCSVCVYVCVHCSPCCALETLTLNYNEIFIVNIEIYKQVLLDSWLHNSVAQFLQVFGQTFIMLTLRPRVSCRVLGAIVQHRWSTVSRNINHLWRDTPGQQGVAVCCAVLMMLGLMWTKKMCSYATILLINLFSIYEKPWTHCSRTPWHIFCWHVIIRNTRESKVT